uniref:Reverse transcriptase Ty1/copia-type domain-containing protein n=2 Tax=Photinus pyralis TaxID=7054 RepID=A0A1Y1N3K4_PHOPY
MLKRFNLEDSKPSTLPADPNVILSKDNDHIKDEGVPYREAVGSLMFAAITARPDIAFAVNVVSRFQNNQGAPHWNAVKRIMRYLKHTKDLGIRYTFSDEPVHGFSDSDYASDVDTRKSTTGYVFNMANGAITWCSRRQQTTSVSTTEAEYVAAAEATKEAIWLRHLLSEISGKSIENVQLYVDNQSAIKLVKNPIFHKRTKHIDVRYHFIKEKFQNGDIKIEYVRSEDQLADILTKPLVSVKFNKLRTKLGMM